MDERFLKSENKRGGKEERMSGWGLREKMEREWCDKEIERNIRGKSVFPPFACAALLHTGNGRDVTHIVNILFFSAHTT